jgi:hypothetical protein
LQFPHAAPSIKQSWPKDHWETFLANAGLNFLFSIEDHFLRNYISKVAGETEIIRECNRQTKACRGVKAIRMGHRKARRSASGRRVAVPNRRQRNLNSTRNQVNWQNS